MERKLSNIFQRLLIYSMDFKGTCGAVAKVARTSKKLRSGQEQSSQGLCSQVHYAFWKKGRISEYYTAIAQLARAYLTNARKSKQVTGHDCHQEVWHQRLM